MAIRPKPGSNTVLKGTFSFEINEDGLQKISDSYALSIIIPEGFPCDMPLVTETDGRIRATGIITLIQMVRYA
jgi:hypothetical protein